MPLLPDAGVTTEMPAIAGTYGASERTTTEDLYRAMSLALPDPCGITRLSDGRYVEVNPAFCQMFGLERDEVVGKTSLELGIWASPAERERVLQAIARDGRADQLACTANARGRQVSGLMSACAVQVSSDSCMVFVFHDMTREHAVYDSLSAAHALLSQAGKMARLGAWEANDHGVLQRWSDPCCDIHGLSPGTPPPGDYIDLFVVPRFQGEFRERIRRCLKDGTPWTLEIEIVRADTGQPCWMRVRGEAVRGGDRTTVMHGVMQDIDSAYRAEQALRESQERFQVIFNLLPYPMGIVRCDNADYLDVNPAWSLMTGFSREEALGTSVIELGIYTPEERRRILSHASRAVDLAPLEATLRQHDGQLRTVVQVMRKMRVGQIECWLFALHDITDRKRAEEAVREREAVLSLTLEAASLGLWDADLITGMVSGDACWHSFRGADSKAGSVVSWDECASPHDHAALVAEFRRHAGQPNQPFDAIATPAGALEGKRWLRNLGNIVAWDDSGKPTRMLGVAIDVTDQRQHEMLLQRLAHYDALTQLPNRVLMAERLDEAMRQARATGKLLGVAYLDLDGFKPVNDRFGHAGGDQLLRNTAERLTASLRPEDCVARLGGDEFAILLPDLTTPEDAERALERVMRFIAAEHRIEGLPVSVTASIGYTLFPRDDADADTLLRHADQAMYQAKQAGRNQYQEFDAAREREARHVRTQLAHLRAALVAGEFELYLQPKVDMRSGVVVGAEALARWNHPERGVVSPAEFHALIDAPENETGFGAWVVSAGLRLIERLQQADTNLPVSLNISATHLQQPGFAEWMGEQLARYAMQGNDYAKLVDLEITETAALFQLEAVAETLEQLRAMGLSISLDDFGTGYSSLSYLRRLPLNILKIDQSFVRGMLEQQADLAIVQSVISLARSFGYKVIAEGVETEDQGQMLLQMGCTLAQGYVIARPMPISAFIDWARTWQAPVSWRQ